MRSSKPILLVEDDRLDAMIVRRALSDLKVTNELVHTANGEEAVEYLRNEENKRPCLILLDLNMPKTNGVEFLRIIKADKVLKRTPVVVLTASTEEQDVIETFKLSVAGYIIKPVDYIKFVEAMRTVALYWTLSELPDGE
ncbi:MAG: response regulator [Planctomycetota bacterium]|nr:response regulator [Planctomycetota bacterium]